MPRSYYIRQIKRIMQRVAPVSNAVFYMTTKQELTQKSREVLSAYRLQCAKKTLLEVDALTGGGFYNAAGNGLYYACYYAVIALWVKNTIATQTYQGVRQIFSLHFIANGKIPPSYSTSYDRISGDYDDDVQYDSKTIHITRPQTEAFICMIEEKLIK